MVGGSDIRIHQLVLESFESESQLQSYHTIISDFLCVMHIQIFSKIILSADFCHCILIVLKYQILHGPQRRS